MDIYNITMLYYTIIPPHTHTPGALPMSVSALEPRARDIFYRVRDFIQKEVIPLEKKFYTYATNPDTKWTVNPLMEELKVCFLQQPSG